MRTFWFFLIEHQSTILRRPLVTRVQLQRWRREECGFGNFNDQPRVNLDGSRFPKTILKFNGDVGLHPTQKPIQLCEYLTRTYSNLDDTVLDCCKGSGTTTVAALNTGRNGIGIEREEHYFKLAQERIDVATPQIQSYLKPHERINSPAHPR